MADMLLDQAKFDEQVADHVDGVVKDIYILLAHANLPKNMTVRPHGHGYISKELRFERDGRWYFSAVLNKNWILWYFRRPLFVDFDVSPDDVRACFPAGEVTGEGAVKLRLHEEKTALHVLAWMNRTI